MNLTTPRARFPHTRLRAIVERIQAYRRSFGEALQACLHDRPLQGRHIGPDALAIQLSEQIRALGFDDV